ncbi:hypothetical protein [Burkholderia ubonensis]|nr:hypothetical protein [Burkholderia ubonensis]
MNTDQVIQQPQFNRMGPTPVHRDPVPTYQTPVAPETRGDIRPRAENE